MREIKSKKYYIFLIFISLSLLIFISHTIIFRFGLNSQFTSKKIEGNFNIAAVGGYTNITNTELNNTIHYHGKLITIEGRLLKTDLTGYSGFNVYLFINGTLYSNYNDTTDATGNFSIDYTIPYDLDVFSSYKLQVNVTNKISGNDIEPLNFLIIFVNATSYLRVTSHDTIPKAEGENFNIDGYLRYDNQYGEGISAVSIYYYWFNSSHSWMPNSFITDSNGDFSEILSIPKNTFSDSLNLLLNFPTIPNRINGSQLIIPNITIFPNISCIWSIESNLQERQQISISGELISSRNTDVKISGRNIRIYYNGSLIHATTTNTVGRFSFTYTIPLGTGIAEFQIEVVNTITGLQLINRTYVLISAAPPITPTSPEIPFLGFLSIFLPILIGAVGVISGYGFYYYKKNYSGKRVVNVPLESKIINLKILKDTNRIEESVSYLFNAIFMELIEAKYGRTRKETETIKDFSIIAVNKFNLDPRILYPFTEKIEEIIYARPNHATEEDFYNACEVFSPVYRILTGYQFILNF
jgi:hypothetical protein